MVSHCLKKKITLENPTFIPKIVFNKSRVEKFVCNFSKGRESCVIPTVSRLENVK